MTAVQIYELDRGQIPGALAEGHRDAGDLPSSVPHRRERHDDVDAGAVVPRAGGLEILEGLAPGQHLIEQAFLLVASFERNKRRDVPADGFLGRAAEELLCRAVPHALRRCPPVFIAQMNRTPGFAVGAHVESVMALFVCEDCRRERQVELEPGESALPVIVCERCEQEMAFDGNDRELFSFVGTRPALPAGRNQAR